MSDTAVPSTSTATEKEARDVAESARETEWENPSFVRELFLGTEVTASLTGGSLEVEAGDGNEPIG